MKAGKIEFSPDSRARIRGLRSQDVVNCEWCGRCVKIGTLRDVKIGSKVFKMCADCPPPDNASGAYPQ